METVADARSGAEYRAHTPESETASMWQSLAFGPNYKAAYCLAVCPAGDDVIAPFRADRKTFLREVLDPLVAKREPVYVAADSDAEKHVLARFPHKTVRRVGTRLRPKDVPGFLRGAPLTFQRSRAKGLQARIGFEFRGADSSRATLLIEGGKLQVLDGLVGELDTLVRADAQAWIGVLRGERSLLWQVLTRRIQVRGALGKLRAFQACFLR